MFLFWKPRRSILALLLAGGLVATLELLSRVVIGLGTPPLSRVDPLLEYAFVPNQDVRRFRKRIIINRYGMRSSDFPPARPPGQRRVLIFGDSVLFGGSTLDQAEIATTILAASLGPATVVGNVSAGSWGPGNWLGWVHRYGLLGATDVVLLTSSHDLFDHPTFAPLNPLTHPTHNPPSALWELWNRYVAPRFLPGAGMPPPEAAPFPVSTAEASSASVRALEQRGLADFTSLVDAVRDSGARLIVVQFWERQELRSGLMQPGYAQQRNLFRQLGVPVLDAGPMMARCAVDASASVDALYSDRIHPFTSVGQRCLSQVLEHAVTSEIR